MIGKHSVLERGPFFGNKKETNSKMSSLVFNPSKDAQLQRMDAGPNVNVAELLQAAPISLVVLSRHMGGCSFRALLLLLRERKQLCACERKKAAVCVYEHKNTLHRVHPSLRRTYYPLCSQADTGEQGQVCRARENRVQTGGAEYESSQCVHARVSHQRISAPCVRTRTDKLHVCAPLFSFCFLKS